MRLLSKELHISIITTKRAYEELDREEYIESYTGKGSFVKGINRELVKETAIYEIESLFGEIFEKAELLIMDESTSGLDPIVRNEILQIFQEYVLEENHTILLSSHITGDLERIADMFTFINQGKIVLSGNKDELLENHGMIKCKKNDLKNIDAKDMISYRQSAFGEEVLVADREKCAKKYSSMAMEQTTLEEIMIFYVNRYNRTQPKIKD